MDPLLQIFQQEQGGSAEGQGFGQFYAQGQQLNLQKQHLALQKREEQRLETEQNVLLPLRQKMLQYENLNRGLEAGKILGDDAAAAQMNEFIPKVNDLFLRFMRSPKGFTDDGLISEYQQLYSQNPWAFSAGRGAQIKQGMDAQLMQRDNWVRVMEHDDELKKRGLYVTEQGAKGDLRFGLRDDELKRLRIENQKQNLLQQRERMRLEGNAQGLREIDQRMKMLEQGIEADNLPPVTFNTQPIPLGHEQPDSGSTNGPAGQITLKQSARPTTPAETTRLQQTNLELDNSLNAVSHLEDAIRQNPDAFGVIGIGKDLWSSLRGQLDPTTDPRVSNARETAGLAFVNLSKGLRVDTGNMSRYERTKLEEIGDTTGWKDYPQRALGKAEQIRDFLVAKKLRTLQGLHQRPDPTVLNVVAFSQMPELVRSGLLDDDSLVDLSALGKLSKEDAFQLHKMMLRK